MRWLILVVFLSLQVHGCKQYLKHLKQLTILQKEWTVKCVPAIVMGQWFWTVFVKSNFVLNVPFISSTCWDSQWSLSDAKPSVIHPLSISWPSYALVYAYISGQWPFNDVLWLGNELSARPPCNCYGQWTEVEIQMGCRQIVWWNW